MDESFQSCFPNLLFFFLSTVLIAQCNGLGSGNYPDLSLVRCDASSIIKTSVLLQQPKVIATMSITIISPSWLPPLSWA